jgi:hypothetical protein
MLVAATTISVTVALAPTASAAPSNWREAFGGGPQKIYRSSEIHKKDASTLAKAGVTTIVAFTGSNPHITGVTFVKVRMAGVGVGGVSTKAGVAKYRKFVDTKSRRAALAKALLAIANAPSSVVVQCWKGKDRTGWTMAILGHILGSSESDIMKDFLKYRPGKSSWLKAALNRAEDKYGSIDEFLTAIGIDAATQDQIRAKYSV